MGAKGDGRGAQGCQFIYYETSCYTVCWNGNAFLKILYLSYMECNLVYNLALMVFRKNIKRRKYPTLLENPISHTNLYLPSTLALPQIWRSDLSIIKEMLFENVLKKSFILGDMDCWHLTMRIWEYLLVTLQDDLRSM